MTESLARQRVLGRMLEDPAYEARLRADPAALAREEGVTEGFVRGLAAIEPERISAFRRSRVHKDEVREGKTPTKLGW
jgi:hypothetical protein